MAIDFEHITKDELEAMLGPTNLEVFRVLNTSGVEPSVDDPRVDALAQLGLARLRRGAGGRQAVLTNAALRLRFRLYG